MEQKITVEMLQLMNVNGYLNAKGKDALITLLQEE